jgi:hypothetical protein
MRSISYKHAYLFLLMAAMAVGSFAADNRIITDGKRNGLHFLIYTPTAITDSLLTSDTILNATPVGKNLAVSGCRGEYESATAALYALENVKQLSVTVSDLYGQSGKIPSSCVDVRVVKCWFQAGRSIGETDQRIFTPELLLKDDSLVIVDMEKKENYLRSTATDGSIRYLLCSGPTSENLRDVRPIDAAVLKPVNIQEKKLKQFWFTVKIPDSAKLGSYKGSVRFWTKTYSRKIPLSVTVYPFDLESSPLTYSLYYHSTLSPDGSFSISCWNKSEEQYRAEISDMKNHGVLYPTSYQSMNDTLLRRTLEIRKEVGLPAGPFFTLGQMTGAATDSNGLALLTQNVKKWMDFLKPFGYHQVYFYGEDEARGEQLKAQHKAWKAVQDAGGKTFVACRSDAFDAMGQLLNCAVMPSRPDSLRAKKWHSIGSVIFCYGYPQVGEEKPETYRRHYGLELWKAGYDGAMDYAYQREFGHIWNDFDEKRYRDHCFTYPTVNGIVGTLQWEGFREAVDDVRYVTTLERTIEKCPALKKDVALEARTWLDNLDMQTVDLGTTRSAIAQWIIRLSQ